MVPGTIFPSGWRRGAGFMYARRARAVSFGAVVRRCAALFVLAAAGCEGSAPDRTSVLLVTIDTCRDDHVGPRAAGPSLTPHLDALAREGRRIPVAVSPSCFTAPAMTSIATGVYPENHGVLQWGIDGAEFGRDGLAARFRREGYRTAFVSGHGGLGAIVPLTAGFEEFRDSKDAPAADVTRHALEWLERARAADPSSPFFLWVHYFDPHSPYAPPPRSSGGVLRDVTFERWRAETLPRLPPEEAARALETLYAGEVAEVDRAIGDLLPTVRSSTPSDRLIVAVTADHGENLSDHEPRYAHHDALFDSLVRVPLFLLGPGVWRLPIDERVPVETVRLAPTLLDLARLEYRPGDFDRPSLAKGPGDGYAYCHSGLQDAPHAALRSPSAKVVLDLNSGQVDAFDLSADPGEVDPRDPASAPAFLELWSGLRYLRRIMPERERNPAADSTLPKELRAWLEQLGYVGKKSGTDRAVWPKNK